MQKQRSLLGQVLLIGSFWTMVWLVSAMEFGAVGVWAMYVVVGIVLVWAGVFCFLNWKMAEKKRSQERKRKRIAKRILDQADKACYIREINAA